MRKEMKIMGDSIDWTSPRFGRLAGRLLHQERETVRMVVAGCAGIIYSSLTLQELEWIREYHPDMLKYTEDDGTAFELCFGEESPGTLNPDKADFGNRVSPDGYPQVTVLIDPEIDNTLEAVMDRLGEPLIRLSLLEKRLLPLLRRSSDHGRHVRTRIIRI